MNKRRLLIIFISLFILFRILLPVRSGQFSQDEALFALRANQILHCVPHPEQMFVGEGDKNIFIQQIPPCGKLPLKGLFGGLGVSHGPYPTYWLTLLYFLTSFHFSLVFLFASICFIGASYLIAQSMRLKSSSFLWRSIFLLSLTSPLMVSFTNVALLDTSWLIVLSALCIYISMQMWKKEWLRYLFLGCLNGLAIGSHIQSLPFIIGFSVWLYLKTKKKKWMIPFLLGFILLGGPYLLMLLLSVNKILAYSHPFLKSNAWFDIFLNIGVFTRFIGAHPFFIVNKSNVILSRIELSLAVISIFTQVTLFIGVVYLYVRKRKLEQAIHPLYSLSFYIILAYAPIVLLSGIGRAVHETMIIWWSGPVLASFVMYYFSKKWREIILSLFVIFQLLIVGIEYLPRLHYGTSVYDMHESSYWIYENVVKKICLSTNRQSILVSLDKTLPYRERLSLILPSMIAIRYPDCVSRVRFTYEKKADMAIRPDEKGRRLEVVVRKSTN
ncbi:MAG: hypothetical protein Q7S61_05970 [bacterium]|nr:hypothetical protein [bacterium]